jgi:hypothetical protein
MHTYTVNKTYNVIIIYCYIACKKGSIVVIEKLIVTKIYGKQNLHKFRQIYYTINKPEGKVSKSLIKRQTRSRNLEISNDNLENFLFL